MIKKNFQIIGCAALLLLAGCEVKKNAGNDDTKSTNANSPFSKHPQSVLATNGQHDVTFDVELSSKFNKPGKTFYQWFFNGAPLAGETNEHLKFKSVSTDNVGFYQCAVEHDHNGEQQVALSEVAELMFSHHSVLTVYGTPVGGAGNNDGCPPKYVGYVIYRLPDSPYGWTFPNGGTATDTNGRNDTVVAYFGSPLSNYGCGTNGMVTLPVGNKCAYRFAIYFKKGPVPSGPYPITLNPN